MTSRKRPWTAEVAGTSAMLPDGTVLVAIELLNDPERTVQLRLAPDDAQWLAGTLARHVDEHDAKGTDLAPAGDRWARRTPAEQHHYDRHSRVMAMAECAMPECKRASR